MNENDNFSWYAIEQNETHLLLVFRNKKGAYRIENKRPLWGTEELQAIKARLEARKERINKIVSEAIKEAMQLAKDNPEEFKRLMQRSQNE